MELNEIASRPPALEPSTRVLKLSNKPNGSKQTRAAPGGSPKVLSDFQAYNCAPGCLSCGVSPCCCGHSPVFAYFLRIKIAQFHARNSRAIGMCIRKLNSVKYRGAMLRIRIFEFLRILFNTLPILVGYKF